MGGFSFQWGSRLNHGLEVVRDKFGSWSYMWNISPFGNSFESKYLDLTLNNPILFICCLTRAKLYSQMKITHVDSNGKEIENSPYIDLLNKPNYFQSKEDWLKQQSWFLSASGNNIIYQKKITTNEVPKALYNLVPTEVDYKDILKVDKFFTLQQDINEYERQEVEYRLDKQKYKLKVKDLIPLYDVTNGIQVNTLMKSPSRVSSVLKNVQNIEENMAAKNVNLKMAQKYLARNKNNIQGTAAQIHPDDRVSIEKVLSEKTLQITNGDIEVQHLVSNLKQLYLDEQMAFDAKIVTFAFEQNEHIINFALTGSTYENQEYGIIRYIQTSTQADADNLMNSLAMSWGLHDKKENLKASYNHLPIMQVLYKTKIETFNSLQIAIKQGLENTTISPADAKNMTDKLKTDLGL